MLMVKTVQNWHRCPLMAPESKALIVQHLENQFAAERVWMQVITTNWNVTKTSSNDSLYYPLSLKMNLESLLDCCISLLIRETDS